MFYGILILMVISSGSCITNQGSFDPYYKPVRQCPDKECKCDGVNIICDCKGNFQEVIVEKLEQTSASDIRINNCEKVVIKSDAVRFLSNLRYLTINNVKHLRLESKSLNWCGATIDCLPEYYYQGEHPSLDITIKNTTIDIIKSYAFSERIRNIDFDAVTINLIKAYAFTNLKGLNKLELKGNFKGIESQAFKKFYTDYFHITQSSFESVPSRTFAEIDANHFSISSSNFTMVNSQGFYIKNVKRAEILSSFFNQVDGEAFKIESKEVQIRNNKFNKIEANAFAAISTTNEARLTKPELQFINNTLNAIQKDSLVFNTTSFRPKLELVILNVTCTCSEIHIWQTNTGYLEEVYCLVNSGKALSPLNLKLFQVKSCESTSLDWLTILLSLLGLLLVVVIFVGLYIFYKRQKTKGQMDKKRGLIVPDGRTYRETELHVIVEKAELLTTEL